jgi:transposase InsO family protein
MAEQILSNIYNKLGNPAAFGSLDRLWREARKQDPDITKKYVQRWLASNDTYTMHRQKRRRMKIEPRTYVPSIDDQWCADLAIMANVADENDNYRYILTVIDAFSKYAWAEQIRTKSGPATTAAFAAIFDRTERRPRSLQTDDGKEFFNQRFQELMQTHGIQHFSSHSTHKAAIAERFNRSLKSLIYKHFTESGGNKWIDILQDAVSTYNKRHHRSIGMAPVEVTAAREGEVYENLYTRKPRVRPGKLFRKGDRVRLIRTKGTFEQGYLPNWTEEVFIIRTVFPPGHNTPYRYQLEDWNGEVVKGKFTSDELQLVYKDDKSTWRYEKVLAQRYAHSDIPRKGNNTATPRRSEFLVKWKGFPDKFNSWIQEEDLVRSRSTSPEI